MKKHFLLLLFAGGSFCTPAQTSTVYFATGSDQPEKTELKKLDEIVDLFRKQPYGSVKVTGYADTTSNWAFNLTLSQKRAVGIKNLLIQKGIPEESICTQHRGESSGGKDLKYDRKAEISLQKESLGLMQIFKEQDVEKQYYTFDPTQENEIRCKQGTVIQIPKDCFVDDQGNTIKTGVNLQVQEYYNLGDYIKQGLFTQSKGQLLQSGGVVNIDVTSKGKKLRFAPGMKAAIGFNSAADSEMRAFMGRSEGVHGGGTVNWDEDLFSNKPGKGSGGSGLWVKDSVPMYETIEQGKNVIIDTAAEKNSTIRTYRFFERNVPTVYVNRFGFINCDKFWSDPTAVEMEMMVYLSSPSLMQEKETCAYMIFQKTMSVLRVNASMDNNGNPVFSTGKMKMPRGSSAWFIVVSKKGETMYFGNTGIELDESGRVKVNIAPTSMAQVKAAMAEFAMN